MDSQAFKFLHEATKEVIGESKPFSICGSLPLVGDLQKAGFDIQVPFSWANVGFDFDLASCILLYNREIE